MKCKKIAVITKKISDCINELIYIECETNPLINDELWQIKNDKERIKTLENGMLKDKLEYRISSTKNKWISLKEREKEVNEILNSAISVGQELFFPNVSDEEAKEIFNA